MEEKRRMRNASAATLRSVSCSSNSSGSHASRYSVSSSLEQRQSQSPPSPPKRQISSSYQYTKNALILQRRSPESIRRCVGITRSVSTSVSTSSRDNGTAVATAAPATTTSAGNELRSTPVTWPLLTKLPATDNRTHGWTPKRTKRKSNISVLKRWCVGSGAQPSPVSSSSPLPWPLLCILLLISVNGTIYYSSLQTNSDYRSPSSRLDTPNSSVRKLMPLSHTVLRSKQEQPRPAAPQPFGAQAWVINWALIVFVTAIPLYRKSLAEIQQATMKSTLHSRCSLSKLLLLWLVQKLPELVVSVALIGATLVWFTQSTFQNDTNDDDRAYQTGIFRAPAMQAEATFLTVVWDVVVGATVLMSAVIVLSSLWIVSMGDGSSSNSSNPNAVHGAGSCIANKECTANATTTSATGAAAACTTTATGMSLAIAGGGGDSEQVRCRPRGNSVAHPSAPRQAVSSSLLLLQRYHNESSISSPHDDHTKGH